MKRSNIPDASNCSVSKNFTQIPNNLLKNHNISSKAKVILSILLSNKEGWHSYTSQLQKWIKEKKEAIYGGIKELEELGYLKRCHYRDKETKQWKGVFLAYTDIPHEFNIIDSITILEENGYELGTMRTKGKAVNGKALNGYSTTNNIKYNNTNNNILCEEAVVLPLISLPDKDKLITTIQFDRFWNIYPKKPDKGKTKTAWDKLCKKNNRPTWKVIKQAILSQIKSDRWQDQTFIPYPATWINESRWLDNPEEMLVFKRTNIYDTVNASNRSRRDTTPKMKYKE